VVTLGTATAVSKACTFPVHPAPKLREETAPVIIAQPKPIAVEPAAAPDAKTLSDKIMELSGERRTAAPDQLLTLIPSHILSC